MAMRDFISINNYSGLGQIGFSRGAIAAVVSYSVKEAGEVQLFSPRKSSRGAASGVKVIFTKDGKALIKMDVTVHKGTNVAAACEKVQKDVATAVSLMCDMVPFDVQVKVMRIV